MTIFKGEGGPPLAPPPPERKKLPFHFLVQRNRIFPFCAYGPHALALAPPCHFLEIPEQKVVVMWENESRKFDASKNWTKTLTHFGARVGPHFVVAIWAKKDRKLGHKLDHRLYHKLDHKRAPKRD